MSKGRVFATIGICIVCVGATSFAWYKYDTKKMTEANQTIEVLNNTVDALGECVTVYGLATGMEAGEEIEPEDLEPISMPSAKVTDSWVTDKAQVVGKYCKVRMSQGTPVTLDLVMSEQIDDTTREHDVCFDYWPVGLKVGDYVDVDLTLPYGEDYVVVPKLRVKEIHSNSIKVDMTAEYWNIYNSALVDYYLHLDQGSSIYLAKYVEPGAQDAAIPYYAVRPNIKAVMEMNPNIIELASSALNDSLRSTVDAALEATDANTDKSNEDEQDSLSSGRQAFNENITSDYVEDKENEQEQLEQQQEEEEAEATEQQSSQDALQDAVDTISTEEEGALE